MKKNALTQANPIFTKAFLKWAGGKSSVLPKLKAVLPPGQRLIEPFCGSCVVAFNLNYPSYLLSDTNTDLIELFAYLKKDGLKFIQYSKQFFAPEYNQQKAFLALRDTFNTTPDLRLRAALFLYLNRHGFNGLCRYNADGVFNVSFGKYKKPYFPEKEMALFSLFAKKAIFKSQDYVKIMKQAKKGDVVYCDPPYTPLTKTANFVSYGPQTFTASQHLELTELAKSLQKKGVFVAISNHYSAYTQALYSDASLHKFKIQRYISCKGSTRQKVGELIAIYE